MYLDGAALRDARTAAGITRDELAVRSGRSSTMIRKYERGTALPAGPVIRRLAEGLGVSLAALTMDEPPPDRAAGIRTRAIDLLAVHRDGLTATDRRRLRELLKRSA